MSSIVTALTGGNGKGMAFDASSANVLNPATVDQANQQYTNMNNGLDAQQQFLMALQGQNGIQNQSNVYNQLQGVAQGTGPNPAQAQLAQATGANVANQAALMAGQRGSSQNAGMMARQAGQQGAGIQQQAAGQAATLQAQQSLGALGQMGNIAGQQVGTQQGATNAYMQGTQGAYGNVVNAIGNQNNANVGMQSNMNAANAAINNTIAQQQGNLVGNIAGSVGSAIALAEGGMVKEPQPLPVQMPSMEAAPQGNGPVDAYKKQTEAIASKQTPGGPPMAQGGSIGPQSMYAKMMAEGGRVPAMVSPGEKYLTPTQAAQVSKGKADPMSVGKTIPGQPKVAGAVNSYANDNVPMTLQEGGIVIPRSVTQAKDAEQRAVDFVRAHYAMQNGKKGK